MDHFFYEEIHRAKTDAPHVDTDMTDIQYCAHYHEEIEIVMILDGEVLQIVDGKCLRLLKGDIALVGPFQIHSYKTPDHSCLYVFKILSPYLDFSAICWDRSVLSPEDAEYPLIYQGIQQVVNVYRLKEDVPLRHLALRCATDQLLIRLARLSGVHPVTRDRMLLHDRDIELLKTLNDYLMDHYQDHISLEDAAEVCHMSMYYFAHSFKKATSTTFLNYLNGYRLEQARHRITETDDSFTNISMQCGFPSIRTFNRCFQKHYLMTPTEARHRWHREKMGDI